MNLPKGQGKKRIVNMLTPSASELAMPQYQKLLKRINNCNATIWACNACTVPQIGRCMDKVRQYLQTQAFKQYHETEQFRKQQEKLSFPVL